MRPTPVMLALALITCSLTTLAADVGFEVGSDAFERPAELPRNFADVRYEHPLYEGLWQMTLEAFLRLEQPRDTEFFTFCIAANN